MGVTEGGGGGTWAHTDPALTGPSVRVCVCARAHVTGRVSGFGSGRGDGPAAGETARLPMSGHGPRCLKKSLRGWKAAIDASDAGSPHAPTTRRAPRRAPRRRRTK